MRSGPIRTIGKPAIYRTRFSRIARHTGTRRWLVIRLAVAKGFVGWLYDGSSAPWYLEAAP